MEGSASGSLALSMEALLFCKLSCSLEVFYLLLHASFVCAS